MFTKSPLFVAKSHFAVSFHFRYVYVYADSCSFMTNKMLGAKGILTPLILFLLV